MAFGLYSVWANRLLATNEKHRMYWSDVPERTKPGVLEELEQRVQDGKITDDQLESILAA